MYYKDKIKGIFSYLLNIKSLEDKITRNILDYDNLYWGSELERTEGCTVNKNSDRNWWLKINNECRNLYEVFFKLYFDLQRRGSEIEVIWGHGLMVWEIDNKKIVHPILTTKMKLSFDNESKALTLIKDNKTIINTSIFHGINIPNSRKLFELESRLSNISLDPRNIESVEKIFNQVTAYLSTDGRVVMDTIFNKQISPCCYPVIYNESVIFTRKNSMSLWQSEITNIISKIDNGYPIPRTVKGLVDEIKIEESKENNDIEENFQSWRSISEEFMFPLEQSLEEEKIINKISENYGVVVQEASELQKTYTIVNLICHLVAHGKRVLVTGETDRTIKVLFKNIPESIKPFCLSVLGNDTNSLKELEKSVEKVGHNLKMSTEDLESEIKELKQSLNICRRNQNNLYNKFNELQSIEGGEVNYGGQLYKVIDVAKWVNENKGIYSWIEDEVHKNQEMPLTKKEFENLCHLLKEVSKEDKDSYDTIKVMIDRLPSSDELCEYVYRFKELSESYECHKNKVKGWRIPHNNRCNYDELLNLLRECNVKIGEIQNDMFGSMLTKYKSSKAVHESFNDIVHKCNDYLLILDKIRKELKGHKIILPGYVDIYKLSDDFNSLCEKLDTSGKIGKVFKLTHPQYSYIIKECKVDEYLLENREQASIVKRYIKEKIILKELKLLWNNIVREYGGKIVTAEEKDIEFIMLQEYIRKLNIIVNWDNDYKSRVLLRLGKILLPEDIDWYKKETYDYLIEGIQSIKNINEYNTLKVYIQITKKLILRTEKLSELYKALKEVDINGVKIALGKIERLNMLKDKFLRIDSLIEKLSRVCPNTSQKITSSWEIGETDFNSWMYAWRWTKWNSLLKEVYNLNSDFIIKSIEEEKRIEKRLIEEIIAKKAWYTQVVKSSESKKRSLSAWMQAVKRIGNGTSKMVSEYRKIAQNEMEICKDVIPVWMMPLDKVIENVKLSDNLFDIVIFSESDQSDIFSICALLRAEKAVVFGDNKQPMKEYTKVDRDLVQDLINKYLKDIPQNEMLDLQTSFYGTALRTFPSRLMIKQYFTCVPGLNSNIKSIDYGFRSRFHKDIYNIIKNKGYSIVSEVRIGSYKVDFMVEGKIGKVAIICDGDLKSKTCNWEELINRQLDLEGKGWIFHRIRGSEFYYDTENTMNKLWDKLRNIDIDEFEDKNILTKTLKVV